MPWMSDEKYEFISDSRDKKITARSAHNKRSHCGKGGRVKFPSDFMSAKELKAMNGECIKYASLKKPMTWEEFKVLPDDLKVQYITSLRERFGVPDKYIAEMLGVMGRTLGLHLVDLKLNLGKGANGSKKWNKESFYAWRTGADDSLVQENDDMDTEPVENIIEELQSEETVEIAESEAIEDSIEERIKAAGPIAFAGNSIPVIPKGGSMTFVNNDVDDILTTLKTLLSGVRVNLSITWDVVVNEND